MTMKKTVRKIKISRAYQGSSIVGNRACVHVPYIRIKGKWLEELGFKEGEFVCVEAVKGKLVVRSEGRLKEEFVLKEIL
jgi:toxic protein SymE